MDCATPRQRAVVSALHVEYWPLDIDTSATSASLPEPRA